MLLRDFWCIKAHKNNQSLKTIFISVHLENLSVKCIPPLIPLLYSKNWVCMGIPIFLIFAPKLRLWVCFEQK